MSLLQRCTRGVVALLTLPFALLATEAGAASVSHFATYPLSPYLNGGTHVFPAQSFPKFDLPGHCLTAVCVTVDGALTGEIQFENFQNFPVTVNVTFTAPITVKRPDTSPILTVQPLTTTTDNMPVFDGTVDYAGTSGKGYFGVSATDADSLCLTTPADLALFSGAGTISLPASATDLCSQTGASSWSIGPKASAVVRVTYVYEECTVPTERLTWGRIKGIYR